MLSVLPPHQAENYEHDDHRREQRDIAPIRNGHGQSLCSVVHTEIASFRGDSICVERTVPATRKTTVTHVHIKAAAHCWSSRGDRPPFRGVQRYMGYATRSEKTSKPESTSHGSVARKR